MRNDFDDDLDNIPSLRADRDRDTPYPEPELEPVGKRRYERRDDARAPRQKRKSAATGALWAMVLALLIALGGLGWWSFQQISMLEMQLVATQDSFARISEDANGRLRDISGKVVATESNVTSESEAVKLRIKQLEQQVATLSQQQQAFSTEQKSVTGLQSGQTKRAEELNARLEQLSGELKNQQGALAKLGEELKAVSSEQAGFKSALAGQSKLEASIEGLNKQVAALKQQGGQQASQTQAISRLEQDLLVLRSELDNRPAPSSTNTSEFDAFRAQMTRSINTLQSQIANLQGQIDAR
ncbi:ATPase [Stutzerimonas nosocomialis]|uniref:ATPase n=1 Tax=Stutzerimonas nosocomialis TaxID=1056496 RepID=A0A5R9QF43_9GAMM|nr:ATPase [Stutzerimonas nosocomialis]TLX63422.1 ATPase [Stutzerimonas nosocomialis]